MGRWSNLRTLGESTTTATVQHVRSELLRRLRDVMGLRGEPPPPDFNPATAYMPVDGMARQIHSDLPAMIIGGLASLLLQMNHPAAMAGVAQFSMYKKDPLGRLYQTAQFLGTTTFGSTADALAVISTVRNRCTEPSRTASIRGLPAARNCWNTVSITTPLSTA